MLRRLFEAFQHYIASLEECRTALRDAVLWKEEYPTLQKRIGRIYDQTVSELAYYRRAIKQAISKANSRYQANPEARSLEILERVFISFRDQTKKELVEARRFYMGKQHTESARSSKRAKALTKLTRDAAKDLVDQMRARGVWSAALVRELGLDRWVR